MENTSRVDATKVLCKKTSLAGTVKEVNKLVGVCGSIAVQGSNKTQLYFADNESNTPLSSCFEPQEIRLVLQSTRGYTEGEVMYIKLILGQLTEQEAWLLFETEIIPELIKNNKISTNLPLSRIDFRYNYVEIIGNSGRLGHTIYDLVGFTDLTTAF